AEPSARPTGGQRAYSQIEPETMPSADFEDGVRRAAGGLGIVAKHVEQCLPPIDLGLGGHMSGFNRARDRLFDQLPRRSCLAEQPIREGQVARSSGAGIHAEPELGFTIAFGIEYPQRLLKMGSGHGEIALKEASQTQAAASGRRFRRPFLFLGFAQEGFGGLSRRPQLAAHQAADEQSIISVEPLGAALSTPVASSRARAKAAFASSEPKPRDNMTALP